MMKLFSKLVYMSILLSAMAFSGANASSNNDIHASNLVIKNATVFDGSGSAGKMLDVRILNGIITEVGAVKVQDSDSVIDATGLVLTPGFIDTHSHHDWGLSENPHATAMVSQGITTVVVGQDGSSYKTIVNLKKSLQDIPVAINVAAYTGHGSIRSAVMGEDFKRVATADEIKAMQAMLDAELDNGSLGLSTGLEYDPGIYSTPEEVIELAKTAAAKGGRYISHMRSEDRALDAAIEELLHIGEVVKLPVQISHIKLASVDLWGQAGRIIKRLDKARADGIDVTADIYPYTYWESTLTVLLPDRNFYDLEAAKFALEKLAPANGLTLTHYAPDESLVGKTVADIAKMRGAGEAQTYLKLIRDAYEGLDPDDAASKSPERVMGESMSEGDIATLIAWPYSNICSDGSIDGHPRGYGAFARAIHKYVVEGKVIPLPEMIRKMTSLSADHVGLKGRGKIAKGYKADLVLFDLGAVKDLATIQNSKALSEGMVGVWVNGERVWQEAAETGARPGEFLPRQAQ